jgi:predicted transcriptional regulator
MTMAEEHPPQQVRSSVRRQAHLDGDTNAKMEELAEAFHRKRGAILRSVMQWGLAHTQDWTIDRSIPATAHPVTMLGEEELLQQVQAAADAHGASVAAWQRHAMRQVTCEDFPPSWRVGETAPRSHDSPVYYRPFTLRLDDETSIKLAILTQTFHRSAAEVIRQLVAQATPEAFPQSWHLAVEERRQREPRSGAGDQSTRVMDVRQPPQIGRLGPSLLIGVAEEGEAARQLELLVNVVEVALDGPFADPQLRGNLPVVQARRHAMD